MNCEAAGAWPASHTVKLSMCLGQVGQGTDGDGTGEEF